MNNLTTLCYIEKEDKYLMLHRVIKKTDMNKDKWIGIGGHFEKGESPEECLVREVFEETGLTLEKFKFRGLVTFVSNEYGDEYMALYTGKISDDIDISEIPECDEGILEWISKKDVYELNIWEGDKIFFKLLEEREDFFSLKLRYDKDVLIEAVLDGVPLKLPYVV